MNNGAIPAGGIPARMIEASTTELQAVIAQVRSAVTKAEGREWVEVEAVYPDRLVIRKDGRYFSYPYTLGDDNQVALGASSEVVVNHTPVRVAEARAAGHVFLESVGKPEGGRWLIRVIEAGMSGNRNFYPDAALRTAVPLVEGTRVFVKSDDEHIKGSGKDVRNLIGTLTAARFVEGAIPDTGSIEAELLLIQPDGDVAVKIREAYERGMHNLFGFSIDALATSAPIVQRGGRRVREAAGFARINSVDLIVEPGAGGRLLRIVEAAKDFSHEDKDMSMYQRMVEAIQKKDPAFSADGMTEDQVLQRYTEAMAQPAGQPGTQQVTQPDPHAGTLAAVRLTEARIMAREVIGAATLPQPAKDKLLTRFTEAVQPFDRAAVDKEIEIERAYLARFTESGKPAGGLGSIKVEDRSIKMSEMLDAFFDPKHKDHNKVHSFKECYIEMTGDRQVTGRLSNCDMSRLKESMGTRLVEATMTSTTFSDALGDSITRRMLADYRQPSQFDVWRSVANVTSVNDFRMQQRIRWGGFGDLPIVAEAAPYLDGDVPTDEAAEYQAAKRGRLAVVTLEMIKNDDVGMIQQIPIRLARVARRTLAKFVLDFLRNNPLIYDNKELFHADRNNLGADELNAASWAAARLAMMMQEEMDSNERLGIPPRSLLVPADLEETAFDLFKQRGTNQDQSFIQTQAPAILPVWYWTEPKDWVAAADPLDIPTIEVGFLDGNQEPELFVQDNPSVGSLFTNDTITYKIRHIYGGAVMDFRGLYKAIVP